jgi:parvulin-like peptidyl-prolyl isomerase
VVKKIIVKIRSNILVVGLILAVVCFVGCKRKTEPAPSGAGKADSKSSEPNIVQQTKVESNMLEPNVTSTPEQKQIIATVNGVSILKSDYEARVEQQIGPVQRQMPANFFEQYKDQLCKKVLDEMVVDILISQKAKEKVIAVTDEEIDNRINEIAKRQKMSLQDFQDTLKAKGEDFGQFRAQVRQNLIFEKLVALDSGPIDFSDSNDARQKRIELAGQYIQKLKSEAKINYPPLP